MVSEKALLFLLLLAGGLLFGGGSALGAEGDAGDALKVFSGEPRLVVVNGYSTSFRWPDILRRKLDRYLDGRRVIEVRKATRGGTPIARWIDVASGEPKPAWERVRKALAEKAGDGRPAIVLAQQSLQWVFGERRAGIRGKDDRERIREGADAIEKYARQLLEDGADAVFIAMHIYKRPMEPEIGNERLALRAFLEREVPNVYAGPDVWTPTKKHYLKAFARDRLHPGPIGNEIMAQLWFETLLEHDGLEVPVWSRREMEDAIAAEAPEGRPGERRGRGRRGRRISEEDPKKYDLDGDGELDRDKRRRRIRDRRAESRESRAGSDASDVGGASVARRIFKVTPEGELAIHLHFPEGWKPGDARPAIVFFFGGAWTRGSVRQFRPQAEYFASRGLVAARADYRVRGRHGTTADKCVEDSKSAVRWLRANAGRLGIDPERIVAAGGSAGGHTAAATAILSGFESEGEDLSVSSKPDLLVLFNPVMNTSEHGDKAGSVEIASKISPNDHLTRSVPPAIVFFGTDDRLLATGEEFVEKAKDLDLAVELYTAEGEGHGFFNRSPWLERTLYLSDLFLMRHGYTEGEPTVKPPADARMRLSARSSAVPEREAKRRE